MANRRRLKVKCHQCKEQIEVGEACRAERLGPDEVRYFHTGCYVRFMDDEKAIDEAFDAIEKRQGDLFKK
jgi:hypothetical protein